MYGSAPDSATALRYDLDATTQNPLRGYPCSEALYGMEPNASLLELPVFSARYAVGVDHFKRGEQDPATLALLAIGARQVSMGQINMCARNASLKKLDVRWPFIGYPELFVAY